MKVSSQIMQLFIRVCCKGMSYKIVNQIKQDSNYKKQM